MVLGGPDKGKTGKLIGMDGETKGAFRLLALVCVDIIFFMLEGLMVWSVPTHSVGG